MLNRPPENQSSNQGSKYSLVVAVAKRARQIIARRESGVVFAHKPVTIALEEIAQGAVRVITRSEQEAEAPVAVVPETPVSPVPEETEEKPPQ